MAVVQTNTPSNAVISVAMEPAAASGPSSSTNHTQSASVLSDPSTASDGERHADLGDVPEEESGGRHDFDEECESDLNKIVQGPSQTVCDWSDIQKDIKAHLKKNQKSLTLSEINQYLIISNFATLHLKGQTCTQASLDITQQWHEGEGNWFTHRVQALAQHYQTFEELPVEKWGGDRTAQSWLYDESVEKQTRDWLALQPTGKVTPQCLQEALNASILPGLGIILKNPLSERTAQRWLIKLGWHWTVVQKGVYIDGHEREDVVKY